MTEAGLTRFGELRARYRLDEALADVRSPVPPGETVRVPLPVDPGDLLDAVAAIEEAYRPTGFASSDGRPDDSYENVSLAYNPAHRGDPHRSTLGSTSIARRDFFYASARTIADVGSLRDSYYDTYGFREPTPAALFELGFLTSRLRRSLVRSRLSIIRAGRPAPSNFSWGWHKDEPVVENLRINIHVTDSDLHRIQVMREDRMPYGPDDRAIAEHRFEIGYGYSWDSHLPHRACALGVPLYDRAAIVLGVSPWFDYDPDADVWTPNEYFGRKHPLQMLVDGDVL
jgi:hypothetical protein